MPTKKVPTTTQEAEMQTNNEPTSVKQTETETPSSILKDTQSLALLIVILAALLIIMAIGLLLVMPRL